MPKTQRLFRPLFQSGFNVEKPRIFVSAISAPSWSSSGCFLKIKRFFCLTFTSGATSRLVFILHAVEFEVSFAIPFPRSKRRDRENAISRNRWV
jgi:hypothetical protein